MTTPNDRKYAASHEWAKIDGDEVIVGITAFAVESLQDLVFIDLPEVGATATKGESFGEIESVKAVSDLMAPLSGEITAVNGALEDDLDVLKTDSYEAGWLVRVKPAGDPAAVLEGLLDAAAYDAQIGDH